MERGFIRTDEWMQTGEPGIFAIGDMVAGMPQLAHVASMAGKLVVPGMAVYNASKFAAVGLSTAVREEYRDTGVSVTAVLPSAVRTRLASGVPLGHGMPTVDPEDVAKAIVGSVDNRRAEITVPRYLAGWDLLNAAVPERVMRLGRKLIVTVGSLMADATVAAAKTAPSQHFVEVDSSGNGKNLQGLQFNTAQAGFLAGYLAAGYSKSVSPQGVNPAFRQTVLEAGLSAAGKACR